MWMLPRCRIPSIPISIPNRTFSFTFLSATSYKFISATASAASGSAGDTDSDGEPKLNFSGVRLEEAIDSRIGSGKLRLDNWISSRINGIRRARVQSSIKSGLVHVNGRVVDKDTLKVYLRFIASATPGACIRLKVDYLPSVRYKVIEILAGGSCSLVEWKLETGRTHQIRTYAKYLGVPLLGDEVYGGTKNMVFSLLRPRTPISLHSKVVKMVSRLDRPCLHALTLGFQHPHTGEQVHFSCEPPADFAEILSQLRRIGSETVSFSKRSNL